MMGTRRGNGAGKGPAAGAGWGGLAAGNDGNKPPTPFASDSPTRQTIPGGKGDPDKMADREAREADLKARADEYLDFYHKVIGNEAEAMPNRLSAADKALDRILGKPVARNLLGGDPNAPPVATTFRIVTGVPRDGTDD